MKKKFFNLIFSKKNKISNENNNIFTGRWLFEENRKTNKNFEIYKYHWIDEKKRLQDFSYIKKIYNKVLNNLVPALNSFNSKKFKTKHWELIIFYFLSSYIFFAYDRWITIKNIRKKYKLKKIEIFKYKKNRIIAHDTEEFLKMLKTDDWNDWQESPEVELLRAEYDWEGADAPIEPSVRSTAYGQVNQLRDPTIYVEDEVVYLLYAVAGESGIALARVDF